MSDLTRKRLRNLGWVLAFWAVMGAWVALYIWPWTIAFWLVGLFALMVFAAVFVWPGGAEGDTDEDLS